MKVQIMPVGDRISLEMDPAGLEAVRSFIKDKYPDVASHIVGVATTLITFGGSEFIFENEWDDPCFISRTAEGDELLRSICNQLN